MSSRHLDLGCGLAPRNPYHHQNLFGCDIREIDADVERVGFTYRKVNLSLEGIPFPDDFFDSISAFDFLEHVPRQLMLPSGELKNPFIELMNEIHRVLRPGGRLLAITPAFPHPSAFVDPTHVNFITDRSHEYFIGDKPGGRMYGFSGHFEVIRVCWDTPKNTFDSKIPEWKQSLRRLQRRVLGGGLSHVRWELQAVKTARS